MYKLFSGKTQKDSNKKPDMKARSTATTGQPGNDPANPTSGFKPDLTGIVSPKIQSKIQVKRDLEQEARDRDAAAQEASRRLDGRGNYEK